MLNAFSGEATDKGEDQLSVEVYFHPYQYTEQQHKLSFTGVSAKKYERQSELAVKNVARQKQDIQRERQLAVRVHPRTHYINQSRCTYKWELKRNMLLHF